MSSSIQADSTMTTYRGVLQESNHAGMTELSVSPWWRNNISYLIERTGRFKIGDEVIIAGYIKTTNRDYDFPVLHVQSIDADSSKAIYRGVLEKSIHPDMTKLKLLFYPPHWGFSYLIEHTGHFEIGDSVVVYGFEKTTLRNYEYPVLHVQSIDQFTLSENSETNMKTIAGTLRKSQFTTMTVFSPADPYLRTYFIERTGNFEIGDEVVITGYVKETNRDLRFPIFHVQSIDEFDCCLNELRGDINLDGKINLLDVIIFKRYFSRIATPPQICFEKRDLNGDSLINEDDAQYLYDFVMHCGPEPVACN